MAGERDLFREGRGIEHDGFDALRWRAEPGEEGESFRGSFLVREGSFAALFLGFREEERGAPPCGEVVRECFLRAEVLREDPDAAGFGGVERGQYDAGGEGMSCGVHVLKGGRLAFAACACRFGDAQNACEVADCRGAGAQVPAGWPVGGCRLSRGGTVIHVTGMWYAAACDARAAGWMRVSSALRRVRGIW